MKGAEEPPIFFFFFLKLEYKATLTKTDHVIIWVNDQMTTITENLY